MLYNCSDITKKANACLRAGHNKVFALVALGIASFEDGDADGALRQYEKALKLDKDCAEAHAGMGISLAKLGRTPEAVKHLKKAYSLSPDCGLLANWLADAYFDKGDLDKAIELYGEAIRKNAEDSNAHNDMADAYRLKGNYEKACELYQQTLQIDPSDTNAMLEMAQCQIQLNMLPEAMQTLKLLIDDFPCSRDCAAAVVVYAVLLQKSGDFVNAGVYFRRALEFFPFNRSVLMQAALCALKTNSGGDCTAYLKRILEIDPSDTRAAEFLARISQK